MLFNGYLLTEYLSFPLKTQILLYAHFFDFKVRISVFIICVIDLCPSYHIQEFIFFYISGYIFHFSEFVYFVWQMHVLLRPISAGRMIQHLGLFIHRVVLSAANI